MSQLTKPEKMLMIRLFIRHNIFDRRNRNFEITTVELKRLIERKTDLLATDGEIIKALDQEGFKVYPLCNGTTDAKILGFKE